MNIEQLKHKLAKNRTTVFAVWGVVLLIIVVLVIVSLLSWPTRSIAAFCSTYKQQDAVLAKSYGDTYSVHPFTHSSNNPHDFVVALTKLDAVAPSQIEPEVKTLKQIFVTIDKDPSQALSASVSGLGAEDDVQNWTSQSCH